MIKPGGRVNEASCSVGERTSALMSFPSFEWFVRGFASWLRVLGFMRGGVPDLEEILLTARVEDQVVEGEHVGFDRVGVAP